jgi:hypothetical protein
MVIGYGVVSTSWFSGLGYRARVWGEVGGVAALRPHHRPHPKRALKVVELD